MLSDVVLFDDPDVLCYNGVVSGKQSSPSAMLSKLSVSPNPAWREMSLVKEMYESALQDRLSPKA